MSTDSDRVCASCRTINFQSIFRLDKEYREGNFSGSNRTVASLGRRINQPPENNCKLCLIFHKYRMQRLCRVGDPSWRVQVFSYKYSSEMGSEIPWGKDMTCLVVLPSDRQDRAFSSSISLSTGYLFACVDLQPLSTVWPTLSVNECVNYALIKTWLHECHSAHESCSRRLMAPARLKLIDCESGLVIKGPSDSSYVALSYVWGRVEPPVINASRPTRLSRTIVDAISVTKSLGYRYLWVDQVCIDQGNVAEKQFQIDQMDLIYQSAEITITAAAGGDCEYGLSGVSRPRASLSSVKLGNLTIVPTLPHPGFLIRESVWAKRAWVLQEAFLSRRRLVFTDNEVYYECNECERSEYPFPQPNKGLSHDPRGRRGHNFGQGLFRFRILKPQNVLQSSLPCEYHNMLRYRLFVEDYSSRDLTVQQDRDRAFLGIINYFSRLRHEIGVGNFWGVPYCLNVNPGTSDPAGPMGPYSSFIQSLLWTIEPKASLEQPAMQRLSFSSNGLPIPSWSWFRVIGQVKFTIGVLYPQFLSRIQSIRLAFNPNTTIEFLQFVEQSSAPVPWQPSELIIDAHITPVDMIMYEESSGRLFVYDLPIHMHWDPTPQIPDQSELWQLLRKKAFALLELGMFHTDATGRVFFLIIEDHGDYATRVGVCNVFPRFKIGEKPHFEFASSKIQVVHLR